MQGVTLIDLLILNNFFYRKHTTTIIVVIIDYCGITDTVLCLLIVSHRKDKLGTWGLGQKKKKYKSTPLSGNTFGDLPTTEMSKNFGAHSSKEGKKKNQKLENIARARITVRKISWN